MPNGGQSNISVMPHAILAAVHSSTTSVITTPVTISEQWAIYVIVMGGKEGVYNEYVPRTVNCKQELKKPVSQFAQANIFICTEDANVHMMMVIQKRICLNSTSSECGRPGMGRDAGCWLCRSVNDLSGQSAEQAGPSGNATACSPAVPMPREPSILRHVIVHDNPLEFLEDGSSTRRFCIDWQINELSRCGDDDHHT
nr:unnamed protein product [Callosobruchus chinensis]